MITMRNIKENFSLVAMFCDWFDIFELPIWCANNGSRMAQFRQFQPPPQVESIDKGSGVPCFDFGRDRITGDVTAKIASSRDENWRNRDKRVSLVRIKSVKAWRNSNRFCRRYHMTRNAYRETIFVRASFESVKRDLLKYCDAPK